MLSRPLVSSAPLFQIASRQLTSLATLAPALSRVEVIAGRRRIEGFRRGCATQAPEATTEGGHQTLPHTIHTIQDHASKCRKMYAALGVVGGGLLLVGSSIKSVPAGYSGVEDRFGTVSSQLRTSGLHIKNPLSTIHAVSLKTTAADFSCSVPSQEGLMVDLHITVQYRVDPNCLISLYKEVGLDFLDILIKPQVHAAVRSATSSRDAKALYTAEREQIRLQLLESLNATLNWRGIIVEDVPLRSIELPKKLTEAIESKLQMEQESQRMDFVLEKERQEAERKAIEARGIAEFQNIVSEGIDEKLLRWKGIEATLALSESPNSKVVVVGSGKDGLPLILGSK